MRRGCSAARVLIATAETITECVRKDVDLVGRVGGDQFAIVVPGVDEEQAHALAQRVRERVHELPAAGVHLSVGLVIVADAQDLTADVLLLAADSALSDSKDGGGDQVHVFRGEPRASLGLVSAIESALSENRFTLHAQPIVELRTGETTRYELLIRMLTAEGAIVPPGAFLPAAERFGLITDIDRWVVARALELAADGTPVAVNLSARSIGDPIILAAVAAAIDRGVDPARVLFEITETAATTNINEAREFVNALAQLGYALALDDFGTGFGTFTYIKNLPAKYIKIDMEFVHHAATSTTDLEVIKSIIGIARSLAQRTIAEGIEDEQTLNLMRDLGVDFAQGFYLGRPAPWARRPRHQRPSITRMQHSPPWPQPRLQPDVSPRRVSCGSCR